MPRMSSIHYAHSLFATHRIPIPSATPFYHEACFFAQKKKKISHKEPNKERKSDPFLSKGEKIIYLFFVRRTNEFGQGENVECELDR